MKIKNICEYYKIFREAKTIELKDFFTCELIEKLPIESLEKDDLELKYENYIIYSTWIDFDSKLLILYIHKEIEELILE